MNLSKSNHSSKQGNLNSQRKNALKESVSYGDHDKNSIKERNNEQSTLSEVTKISLLEEKLVATRRQQKIGEVIVRKQVETQIVQIPIRQEKLVVERIGKNPELLTEVVIHQEKINGFDYEELQNTDSLHITKSNYLDLQTAQVLLDALAHTSSAENSKVRLEITTNCAEQQEDLEDIFLKHQL